MALGGTDLNLLVALKALLEEVNVTRAGERLGMSQPSMSAALAKLRRRFNDELMTRSGRDYELTPLGRAMLPEVQRTVRVMSDALGVAEPFDPATSSRSFRLVMSDYAVSVVHQPLLAQIGRLAPGVRLQIDPMPPNAFSDTRLVGYDAMIAPMGMSATADARVLWRDRMVCLVDRHNRWLQDGRLDVEALRRMPHAVASLGPGVVTPVDRAFGELGINRRIQVQVAGWLPMPFVIQGSQMVATVPERLARLHVRDGGSLLMVDPPFDPVVLVEGYWYPPTAPTDPAGAWLLERFEELRVDLAATAPAGLSAEPVSWRAAPHREAVPRAITVVDDSHHGSRGPEA